MKFYPLVLLCISLAGCTFSLKNTDAEKRNINNLLDEWHEAAAEADFVEYFHYLDEDAIYMGTDATEHWDKNEFKEFARPYFDKGKAWNFNSLERNIFIDKSGKLAWFDELLNTQMKICRGSGVLIKDGNKWRIKQYVLSMTIPNDLSDEVVGLKSPIENELINKLKNN